MMESISAYETILLERKREMCSVLDTLAEISKVSGHTLWPLHDEGPMSGSTELSLSSADSESAAELRCDLEQQLGEIEEALARIEDGTFGCCHACGERLGDFRLRVFPEARRCLQCQLKWG